MREHDENSNFMKPIERPAYSKIAGCEAST
jgi:hypothetical protein